MRDSKSPLVVLAVDDEALILWGTAALLESLGYNVVRANSGALALHALRADPDIAILITDFQMPNMSGTQLAEAATALRPDLPVIIATGDASLRGGEDQAWRALAKPYTRDELAHVITVAVSDHVCGARA
jgi:CheY-like chemotaxis protein